MSADQKQPVFEMDLGDNGDRLDFASAETSSPEVRGVTALCVRADAHAVERRGAKSGVTGARSVSRDVRCGTSAVKRSKQDKGECYLCGSPATTRDHIPPLGVFPEPRPTDLITVPACCACNHDRSLHDEYFRLMVAAGSRDSPQSIAVLHQRIIPRVRETPALIVEFMRSVQRLDVHSAGGIYLGRASAFSFDRPRIQVVIDKIVRGLFLKHTKRRLAADCVVEDFLYNPVIQPSLQEAITPLRLFNVGDGSVFSYSCCLPGATGSASDWFLMFYNDTSLFVTQTTEAPNKAAAAAPGSSALS